MSDPQDARRVADREAAEWHVRLGERPLSAATLSEFRAWRAATENADAYRRLETLWRAAGALSGDADVQGLARETLRSSRTPSARPRKVVASLAAVIAILAIAAVSFFVWLPSRGMYMTAVGEQQTVQLADGSEVRLDTDTRIRVQLTGTERRVLLVRGQALFVVAHDLDRPFRVTAGETVVTALGTTFDVRREAAGAKVVLVDGSVAVVDGVSGSRSWRLAPGQQVETTKPDAAPVAVDAALATSWSQGRLVFSRTPLREAVAEVNRYLPRKIILDAGLTESVSVNGVFRAGDREAFVAAATDLFGLEASEQPDGSVRLTLPSVGG